VILEILNLQNLQIQKWFCKLNSRRFVYGKSVIFYVFFPRFGIPRLYRRGAFECTGGKVFVAHRIRIACVTLVFRAS
jgi:hypothetical protein